MRTFRDPRGNRTLIPALRTPWPKPLADGAVRGERENRTRAPKRRLGFQSSCVTRSHSLSKRTAESNRQPEGCVTGFKAACATARVLSAGCRGVEPRWLVLETGLVPGPLPIAEDVLPLNYPVSFRRQGGIRTRVSLLVDRRGVEPRFRDCQPRVLPLDDQPVADDSGDVALCLRQYPFLRGLGCTGPSRLSSWSRRELNPRSCNANAVSSRWTTTPNAALGPAAAAALRLSGGVPQVP